MNVFNFLFFGLFFLLFGLLFWTLLPEFCLVIKSINMASVLTWGELFFYLGMVLFVYYVFVLILFYRHDIAGLAAKRTASGATAFFPSPHAGVAPSAAPRSPDELLYNAVHELMEDCKTVFQAALSQQLDREPVLETLRIRIARYPQLRGTAFQVALSNHVEQEVAQRLGWTLSAQELQALW